MTSKTVAAGDPVALVTGGSSGIGKAAVRDLLGRGMTVYAAARRVDRMEDLVEEGARALYLDVTDDASIVAVVEQIRANHGGVTVLVNNAGYGSYGAVEDVPIDEARRQFEVNIFGLARLTQLVLPQMRDHRRGRIINISSIGGKMYTPLGAWYHATKHGLEGFSDALRLEVAPFGVDVVVIEPGAIKSEWDVIAAESADRVSGAGAYAAYTAKVTAMMRRTYEKGKPSPPETVARTIGVAATVRKPRTRYAVGRNAGLLLFLRRWLSDRGFDRVIRSAYGI